MSCQFYERKTCQLVARETGLPLHECAIRKDACRVCLTTDTPRTGAINHVVASIAIFHARRHQLPLSLLRRLSEHTLPIEEPTEDEIDELSRMPGFVERVKRFSAATQRWVKAGRPVRPRDEVERLFRDACQPCRHFERGRFGEGGNCRLCGCKVNLGRRLNKLRWATETCPDDPPKFRATVREDGTPIPDGEPAMTPHAEAAPVPSRAVRQLQRQIRRLTRQARRADNEPDKQRLLAEVHACQQTLDNLQRPIDPAELEVRLAERQRRALARAEKKRLRWSPPLHVFPPNEDPLYLCDRHEQPIGHALRDLWRPNPGFLVCGGPSLRQIDLGFLRERGIVSLAVNNVSGYAPVRAMTFSDPPEKFHHGVFFDPTIMKLVPIPKLGKRVRAKRPDGTFGFTSLRVKDCPNVWGFRRNAIFDPATFLAHPEATWGNGKQGVLLNQRPHILFTFFLAFRLLHYLGCREVYLLGVDFKMAEDRGGQGTGYAFGERRHRGAVASNFESYRKANAMCRELRPVFDAAGFQVYNCNPDSGLTAFEHVPLETAIARARGLVPPEPWPEDTLQGWYAKHGDQEEIDDDRGEDD